MKKRFHSFLAYLFAVVMLVNLCGMNAFAFSAEATAVDSTLQHNVSADLCSLQEGE